MALPPNFSHWEHLQDMLRREHNKTVTRYFRDLGTDWQPNINKPRDALRTAVTMADKDTDVMTLMRLYLFYEVLGYGKRGLGRFFGTPVEEFEESVAYKPQVFLYFSQDKKSTPNDFQPIEAEISFRLVDETSSTITPTKAKALANQIKQEMIEGNKGITFAKGKDLVTYTDKKRGYALQIYATSEQVGESLIKKILSIRNHPYDNDLQKLHSPKKNSVNKPTGTQMVYGRQRPNKRWRPTANVRFRYAYLSVSGNPKPIYLVDTTGYHFDAFVRV